MDQTNNTEGKATFSMTYSAQQQAEIASIRKKYAPQVDQMEQLRALDAAVGRRATVLSLLFGIGGALILGTGMSLIMTDLGLALGAWAMPVGVAAGIVGGILLACAYPVYRRVLQKEREKAAPQILRLIEEMSPQGPHTANGGDRA